VRRAWLSRSLPTSDCARTRLFYNPHPEARISRTDVGPSPVDLYDTVRRDFLQRTARGRVERTRPPNAAAIMVAAPAGGRLTQDENRRPIEGATADLGEAAD
jgi:hypothetical protein